MEAALKHIDTALVALAFVVAPPEIAVALACAARLCLAARQFVQLESGTGAVLP